MNFVQEDLDPHDNNTRSISFKRGDTREYMDLEQLGIEVLVIATCSRETLFRGVEPGPYLWTDNGFHNLFRFFEDTQGAFLSSIRQGRHVGSPLFHEERPTSYIPVQCRSQLPVTTSDLPLWNLRFSAKDTFDIQGLKTSAGSRSFYAFYPARSVTAPVITALIDGGAKLVGKTKNTQFANGEDPQEWIDYCCPWNPRGTETLDRQLNLTNPIKLHQEMATKIQIQVVVEMLLRWPLMIGLILP